MKEWSIREAMHCEWVDLVDLVGLVSFDEPVTGPPTRSPEVPAAAVVQRSPITIGKVEQRLLDLPIDMLPSEQSATSSRLLSPVPCARDVLGSSCQGSI